MEASRDPNGPDHKPQIKLVEEIEGVLTLSSPFVEYENDNLLAELYRPEWYGVFGKDEGIEHLYTVYAPTGGARSEWYFHEHTIDRYLVMQGSLKLGLYDGRKDSKTFGNFQLILLSQPGNGLPNAVRIPPFVWHSLRWESKQGILLNAKLPGYRRVKPDKFRVQPNDYPKSIIWDSNSK